MGVEAGGPGPGSQRPTGHLAESSAWKGPGKGLKVSGKARGGSRKPKEARGGPGRPQKVQDAEGKVREGPRRPGRLRLSREARGGLSRPGWPSGLRSPGGGRGGRRGRA